MNILDIKNNVIYFLKKRTIYLMYKDIINFNSFKKIIKLEESKADSLYNRFGFNTNKKRNRIGCIISLPDECSHLDEETKLSYVYEKIAPIMRYLDMDLQFGEYLNAYEPDEILSVDDNNVTSNTLSYFLEFKFAYKGFNAWRITKMLIYIISLFALYGFIQF